MPTRGGSSANFSRSLTCVGGPEACVLVSGLCPRGSMGLEYLFHPPEQEVEAELSPGVRLIYGPIVCAPSGQEGWTASQTGDTEDTAALTVPGDRFT